MQEMLDQIETFLRSGLIPSRYAELKNRAVFRQLSSSSSTAPRYAVKQV